MPGTIVFKPIEANLVHNTDFITKMNPYCTFIADGKRFNSQVCKKGGKHPHWNDTISVPIPLDNKITLELMDKDRITKDDQIGFLTVNVSDLQTQGEVGKWYPLQYKNKPAGEILLEASIQGDFLGSDVVGQTGIIGAGGMMMSQPSGIIQREEVIIDNPVGVVQEEVIVNQVAQTIEEPHQTFVEQRQTIEPHTFTKEIDVVETQPVLKEVEVFEPRRVLKEVQYTQVVPVRKVVDTADVQVVTKEIEVMEPRLVTKTIQVVENVPVTKQVEVIESVSSWQDVQIYEPQTFTKQVEVTEQVPVMKTITVTEPVTLKRAVEFVEPIITTQTITKEIKPEIIVNQQVTKSVGAATYVGEITELSQRFSQVTLTEQERLRYLSMSEQQAAYLSQEEKWRWYEAKRLSGQSGQFGQYSSSQYGGQYGQLGQSGQFGTGSQLYSSANNYYNQGLTSGNKGLKTLNSAEKKHHHSFFHKKF